MPQETKKARAPVSNPKAMRHILRHIDANLGLLRTKQQGLNWLGQLSQLNQYPYSGGKDIGPFHNAVTLWDAIGYAVRDNKKEQYKPLKGEPARVHLFRTGSAMLEPDYLARLRYVTIDAAGAIQLRDEADAELHDPDVHVKMERNDVPQNSTKSAKRKEFSDDSPAAFAVGSDDGRMIKRPQRHNCMPKPSLPDGSAQCPRSRHDPAVPPLEVKPPEHFEIEDPQEVIYEPILTLPDKKIQIIHPRTTAPQGVVGASPQLVDKKVHQVHASPALLNETPCRPALLSPYDITHEIEVKQDLQHLRDMIANLATKLNPEDTPLKLAGLQLSKELKAIYVELFDGNEFWGNAFEDTVEHSTITPCTVLKAIIWTYLNLGIFRKPLPWTLPLHAVSHFGCATGELRATLSTITLQLLQEVHFIETSVRPKAQAKAILLDLVIEEHLNADSGPSPLTLSSNWIESITPVAQKICELAFLLKARLEATTIPYRLFKYRHRAVAYCLPVLDHNKGGFAESVKNVAFTIAPGMEQVLSNGSVKVVEPAMIALVGREGEDREQ